MRINNADQEQNLHCFCCETASDAPRTAVPSLPASLQQEAKWAEAFAAIGACLPKQDPSVKAPQQRPSRAEQRAGAAVSPFGCAILCTRNRLFVFSNGATECGTHRNLHCVSYLGVLTLLTRRPVAGAAMLSPIAALRQHIRQAQAILPASPHLKPGLAACASGRRTQLPSRHAPCVGSAGS